jgi:hypothetical protein
VVRLLQPQDQLISSTKLTGALLNVAKRVLFILSIFNFTFPAEHKLVASDPAIDDYFGSSVAVSGDYAIIGSYYDDDDAGFNSGSAYIFNRVPESGNWIQTAKLQASDADASNQFGYSVDMHGDYAIVGAYGNAHPTTGMEAAYIFQKDAGGEDWIQRAKLVANDPFLGDNFGISVAIDLDYALVGATGDDDVISESGSAYVFKRDEGLQSWSLKDKLTESNASQGANFGNSVELQGDYAILSSHRGTTESALIFKKDAGAETWTEQAILIPADWSAGDEFGVSVSISEDYAVVGSRYEDTSPYSNSGAAYVFKRDSGQETWTEMAKLQASDGSGSAFFGSAVAILNRQIIVGAYSAGKAYLFDRGLGAETWTETVILPQSSIDAGQHFGESVDLSGSFLLCGAPWDDESFLKSGSAYLIDQSDFSLPVELSAFNAHSKSGNVGLSWTTSSEVENLGFILERCIQAGTGPDIEPVDMWIPVASYLSHPALTGQGSTTSETDYQFLDKSVVAGKTYVYRLSDVDYRGNVSRHKRVSIVVRDHGQDQHPASFKVTSIYPNPFNPGTTLSYTLNQEAQVSVSILDLTGRVVTRLVHQKSHHAGAYTLYWDGSSDSGEKLSSGIFFMKIQSLEQSKVHRIVMIN